MRSTSEILVSAPFTAHDSPPSPDQMDWSTHYPTYFSAPSDGLADVPQHSQPQKEVEWADVGCGFGGLLMALAPQFPDTLMLGEPLSAFQLHLQSREMSRSCAGMEIRVAVTAYVRDRILASRQIQARLPADSPDKVPGSFENVSVIRANSMKHMPNFFRKGQLTKIFFLFPDPHFKLRKQKARIVT